jgi:hypothetical protein
MRITIIVVWFFLARYFLNKLRMAPQRKTCYRVYHSFFNVVSTFFSSSFDCRWIQSQQTINSVQVIIAVLFFTYTGRQRNGSQARQRIRLLRGFRCRTPECLLDDNNNIAESDSSKWEARTIRKRERHHGRWNYRRHPLSLLWNTYSRFVR